MEWISVKDRLPEKETEYHSISVLCTDGFQLWIGRFSLRYKNWQTVDIGCTDETCKYTPDTCGCDLKLITTHWMLLPEPPK